MATVAAENVTVNAPAPEAAGDGSKRVNVVFTADQFATLQRLASSQNINLSDALRQAINLSSLIVDANNDKNTQILFKKGDNMQELKLVR
jgi:hypothetical protein